MVDEGGEFERGSAHGQSRLEELEDIPTDVVDTLLEQDRLDEYEFSKWTAPTGRVFQFPENLLGLSWVWPWRRLLNDLVGILSDDEWVSIVIEPEPDEMDRREPIFQIDGLPTETFLKVKVRASEICKDLLPYPNRVLA